MWNKNRIPTRHRKTGQAKVSSKSARKTRTKTRKPKYVSLKLELASPRKKPETPQRTATKMPHKQQLTLFPLHPELGVHDRDMQDDQAANEVAFLFETSVEDTSITLQGLLGNTATTTTATSDEGSPLSPTHSLSYVSRGNEESENMSASSLLLRSAMRSKERDASTERWVSYREVVKKEQEEESSCCCGEFHRDQKGLVGLKLDYEQILNAWSNKGSLYVEGASPQTVPNLHDSSSVLIEGMGYYGNLWRVPEMDSMRIMEKVGAEEEWRSWGLREASVLRYKEKRQSRLFSKRIRYEVRKRNAEKRPRMKGRFVKRSGEE